MKMLNTKAGGVSGMETALCVKSFGVLVRTLRLQKNQECVRVLFQHFSEEILLNHEIEAATAHPHFLDGGDWIGRVELKYFHKLTAPLLKAFIHSRTFATVRPPQGSALPKKGSLEDAGRGEKTLVTMAWECRQQPIILKGTVHLPSKTRIIQPITISMPAPVSAVPVKASQLIVSADWVSKVETAFVLPEHIQLVRTPDDAARADHLQDILTHRLYVHVNTRVLDRSKHSHWCLQWAQDNLPHLCAMAVMTGHIKATYKLPEMIRVC